MVGANEFSLTVSPVASLRPAANTSSYHASTASPCSGVSSLASSFEYATSKSLNAPVTLSPPLSSSRVFSIVLNRPMTSLARESRTSVRLANAASRSDSRPFTKPIAPITMLESMLTSSNMINKIDWMLSPARTGGTLTVASGFDTALQGRISRIAPLYRAA